MENYAASLRFPNLADVYAKVEGIKNARTINQQNEMNLANQERKQQTNAQVAPMLKNRDYTGAANAAFDSGDIESGQKYQMQQQTAEAQPKEDAIKTMKTFVEMEKTLAPTFWQASQIPDTTTRQQVVKSAIERYRPMMDIVDPGWTDRALAEYSDGDPAKLQVGASKGLTLHDQLEIKMKEMSLSDAQQQRQQSQQNWQQQFNATQQNQDLNRAVQMREQDLTANKPQWVQTVGKDGLPVWTQNRTEGTRAYSPTGVTNKLSPQQVLANDAQEMQSLIEQARPLISDATGSGVGAQMDAAGNYFGTTTKGANYAAKLKVIGGAIVAKMPKPPGPASDRDIELAKDQGAMLGDPRIPAEQKISALESLAEINSRQVERAIKAGLLQPIEAQNKNSNQNENENDVNDPLYPEYLRETGGQ